MPGAGGSAVGQRPRSASPPTSFRSGCHLQPSWGGSLPLRRGSHGGAGRGQPCVVAAAVTLGGKSGWKAEWGQQPGGVGMATRPRAGAHTSQVTLPAGPRLSWQSRSIPAWAQGSDQGSRAWVAWTHGGPQLGPSAGEGGQCQRTLCSALPSSRGGAGPTPSPRRPARWPRLGCCPGLKW